MTTILAVDDDDIVAQTIERTLRRHDFQTILARSGVEALKLARRHPPDLVILDVMMPGMSGYQVCQEMRQDPLLADLPILFLTAKSKEDNIIDGFISGADDYLTKPFNIKELIFRIKAILRRTQGSPLNQRTKSRQLQVGKTQLDCRAVLHGISQVGIGLGLLIAGLALAALALFQQVLPGLGF